MPMLLTKVSSRLAHYRDTGYCHPLPRDVAELEGPGGVSSSLSFWKKKERKN